MSHTFHSDLSKFETWVEATEVGQQNVISLFFLLEVIETHQPTLTLPHHPQRRLPHSPHHRLVGLVHPHPLLPLLSVGPIPTIAQFHHPIKNKNMIKQYSHPV